MAAIVQCEGVFTPENTSTVVVASRANWQDPLGATALAGAYDAPLLLAGGPKDALPSATKKELQRLKPNKVVVIGPESIVSKSTFEEIKKAAGTGNVQRINGATPVVRADNMLKSTSNWKGGTAVVATQNSFKDSLSATPVSYAQKYPVVFVGTKVSSTEGGKLGSSTLSALKSKGIKKCIIVGGPIAVSRQVEKQLKSAGMTYERWYGQDSLETSAVIATRAMDQFGMTTEHVSVARSDGNNYVDALAGTALTGRLNSVLILANSQWKIGSGTRAFDAIRDRIQGKLVHGHVYGGTGAISEQYMDYFRQVQ